jgi:hypothetical protein
MLIHIFIVLKSIDITNAFYVADLAFSDLYLAIFTEKLVAFFTLLWFIWELETDNTLNLLNHFSLEFVLNFIHLNVK